ncbi:carbon storage regulator [Pseudomaricurvus alkylphenolicus]|uniref:carbon storage regulator n=1 Tax=Pseudomaricurvus alkylphenolicus TaxID=1306991 RepID=UPI00142232FD|nr:carbon storage regulator [Pseudomaricurvus alkylphenolicus]NIB43829.1 carbon storage regulator [Pseudomaricurvus alkylphenolicus]
MLVLSASAGKSIFIGDDIRVTILGKNSNNQYRVGIQAPKNVLILREELVGKPHAKKQHQKKSWPVLLSTVSEKLKRYSKDKSA